MIWHITQIQGQLPGYFLNTALKTRQFYKKTWPNIRKLMTPHGYAHIPVIDCVLSSPDDLKTILQKPDRHLSEMDSMAEKADLEKFVKLVKQMPQLDPTYRITTSQVLQDPFITMFHLKDSFDSSSYVRSCFDLMDICCPKSLSTEQNESIQKPPSMNQTSTSSSCLQKSLTLSEEKKPRLALIRALERKKRTYTKVSQMINDTPECSSPGRGERSLQKHLWQKDPIVKIQRTPKAFKESSLQKGIEGRSV